MRSLVLLALLLPAAQAAELLSNHDLGLINRVVKDPANITFGVNQFKLQGFVDDINTYYRLPSARRIGAKARIRVRMPRAGTFYPAFVLYDTEGQERLALAISGTRIGEALAERDNYRQRLFFSSEPVTFRGGEQIELRPLNTEGIYRIESIVLLRDKPAAQQFTFELRDVRWYEGTLTWRTNWAAACKLEFDGRTITETDAANNHRAVLNGTQPGREYRYRITAKTFDGSETSTGWRAISIPATPMVAGATKLERVPLSIERTDTPVSAGVPFPRGELGSDAHIRLLDTSGAETALQTRVLARWPDGSVKWALLDFLPNSKTYAIEYGAGISREPRASNLRVSETAGGIEVQTGAIAFRMSKHSFGFLEWIEAAGKRVTAANARSAFYLTGADGTVYDTLGAPDEVVLEDRGPVRACIRIRGSHRAKDGRKLFRYVVRIHAWAGERRLRIQHTFENDNAQSEFTDIQSLVLRLPLAGEPSGASALKVRRDTQRVPGTLRRGGVTFAVRDFWQNYPKDLVSDARGLEFGICPRLRPDEYANARGTVDEHRLFFYLRDGVYRIRQGMSKTHEFWIGIGETEISTALALAVAPADWYARTGALGHLSRPAPGNPYDVSFARGFRAYRALHEANHEYGMLNWGDWWGEREINWGNCEYDTQHALLLQFARTGVWKYFREGERAEWHNRDVDTVHAHGDARKTGGVWDHKVGHTGDYFPGNPDAHLAEAGDMTPSHTFIEGHLDYYFLTGDTRSLETARLTADRYSGRVTRNYDLTSCRQAGWLLTLAVSAHQATGDPHYLNLARIVFERALELQTEDGGWRRKLARGHCDCLPRHMGNVGFMVGVLMSGLRMYYDATGDERAADSIVKAARFLVNDMWMPEQQAFRYTSCPRTTPSTNNVALEGLSFALARSGDGGLREPLRLRVQHTLKEISGFGKSFTQSTRQPPRYIDEALELTKP